MKITKQELGRTINRFLTVLEKEDITVWEDLEDRLDRLFQIDEKRKDIISIRYKQGLDGLYSYAISYVRQGSGTIIEIKINQLDYAIIVLKSKDRLEGYSKFGKDRSNNGIYYKNMKSAELQTVIEKLKEYEDPTRT